MISNATMRNIKNCFVKNIFITMGDIAEGDIAHGGIWAYLVKMHLQ